MRTMENSLGKIQEKQDGIYHINMKMSDGAPYTDKPRYMRVTVNLNKGKIESDTESLLHFVRLIVVPIMEEFFKYLEQYPVFKKMFEQRQVELQKDVKEAIVQQEKMGDLSGQKILVGKALDAILWAEYMTDNFLAAMKYDIQQNTGLWTKEKFWNFLKMVFKCEEIK